ncbi:hypothetical protein NX722_15215 [Endozoicomonas gorgoniicola]|uniref:MarR family transcriptional regulator n=1 Tax=Endozoicomonas gorgoniicola TaxID=1234144 RepID=A0ABT3MX41_9GAMM|nr:hypothetical protein [Endozoicomonas gorgoniicola]MCW7553947.1 hypothetical protein [Endozoicomonas gorgoniicola]
MKGQDIGLLLKLYCLSLGENQSVIPIPAGQWQDWSVEQENSAESSSPDAVDSYGVRTLAQMTGISKSQVNLALNRCYSVGLAKKDRRSGTPSVNRKSLFEFIVYGLKFVFPASPGAVTRGITTSLVAPVFDNELMSAGELVPVWPDARGLSKGQGIEPLFKSATYAIRKDPALYVLLALVDAIRMGQPRERNLAIHRLENYLGLAK